MKVTKQKRTIIIDEVLDFLKPNAPENEIVTIHISHRMGKYHVQTTDTETERL